MKVLLTGASGFIGGRFMEYNEFKFDIFPQTLRQKSPSEIDWRGVNIVVHMAGEADNISLSLNSDSYDVNKNLTKNLAVEARRNGVEQFIYLSSIKVYADELEYIDNLTICAPSDAYGLSKLRAEDDLKEIETETFKVAIIRSPVVYGPEVKGNILRLLKLCEKPLPLPFKSAVNQRPMIFVDNLIEMINSIIETQSNGIYIAGDSEPLTTKKMISMIRKNMGRTPGLFTPPKIALWFLTKLKPNITKRLYKPLVINTAETNRRLGFTPPFAVDDGVQQMVKWYVSGRNS